MNKKTKTLLSLFCVFMTLVLCASITLSVISLNEMKRVSEETTEMNNAVRNYLGIAEDEAKEDDVVIAQRYTIKSTKQISDAYLSNDSSNLSDSDKETLELASKVIKKIIKPEMTDYEKEKAVYLYLTKTMKSTDNILTVIPSGEENYEPHDVLKYKSAVCVGYATTFRLFMHMLGIECMVVHSDNLTHSWDLIKLDGDWYHTDCYSDNDAVLYANFNMNDEICLLSHTWTRENFPAAEGTKYNYVLRSAKALDEIYDLPEYVGKMISKEKSVISCSFKKLSDDEQRIVKYISDSMQNVFSSDDKSVSSQWIMGPKGEFVCVVTVSYYSYEDDINLDDETTEKIDRIFSEIIEKYDLGGGNDGGDYYPDYYDGGVYYNGAQG